MKTTSKIALILLAIVILCSIIYKPMQASFTPAAFSESRESLDNPYQGWYRIYGYQLTDDNNTSIQKLPNDISRNADNRLTLLQINLSAYRDKDISKQALQQLDTILSSWAKNNQQLIVRFLYDWNGNGMESEPDNIEQVQSHMTQVSKIVNRYCGHIYILQGIFVGSYGEMNHSDFINTTDMQTLVKHWAAVTDSSIYLSVRTPAQWRTIAQSMDALNNTTAFKADAISRLGLFNDGMLGSENDLGTYGELSYEDMNEYEDKATRTDELSFQNTLCAFVPNGGEVVLENPINDLENAIFELSTMHVSYLNCDYDTAVLNKWKRTTYHNEDSVFDGMSGYEYIEAHLGYRYVLRSAQLDYKPRSDKNATLTLKIENTGFANALKEFDAVLTLEHKQTGETFSIPLSTDNRFWNSQNTTAVMVSLPISEYEKGDYTLFFHLTDPALDKTIRLANDLPLTKQGYSIGTLTLTK